MAIEVTKSPFSLLKSGSVRDGMNQGGSFKLPANFDQGGLAAGFYLESEVPSMQADQTLHGTKFSAPGWAVWKEPDFLLGTKTPNPDKGKKKTVTTRDKVPEVYVLMCRPMDVQQQVNEVYGMLSRERMDNEIATSAAFTSQDTGMLSDERLKSEIGAEAEAESIQRGHAVAPVMHGGNGPRPRVLSVTH